MTWLLALVLGAVIGITLGGLGGGGSVLAVPMLVYLLGQTPQEATSASLFIVGLTAVISTAQHARSGNVRWGLGIAFAAAGVIASFAGTALNARVDGTVLLVSFAGVMLAAAGAMLVRARPRRVPTATAPATEQVVLAGAGAGGPGSPITRSTAAGERRDPAAVTGSGSSRAGVFTRILVTGSVVGFLTGFLGVGGGFVIVPALVTVLGLSMRFAVGTSLLIIVLNSVVALIARLGGNNPLDWSVVIPFTAAAIAASFVGKRISDRIPAQRLTQAFAVLVLIVAVLVLVEAL